MRKKYPSADRTDEKHMGGAVGLATCRVRENLLRLIWTADELIQFAKQNVRFNSWRLGILIAPPSFVLNDRLRQLNTLATYMSAFRSFNEWANVAVALEAKRTLGVAISLHQSIR